MHGLSRVFLGSGGAFQGGLGLEGLCGLVFETSSGIGGIFSSCMVGPGHSSTTGLDITFTANRKGPLALVGRLGAGPGRWDGLGGQLVVLALLPSCWGFSYWGQAWPLAALRVYKVYNSVRLNVRTTAQSHKQNRKK